MSDIIGIVNGTAPVTGGAEVPGAGTMYHDKLINREKPDQHPMVAIQGLVAALRNIPMQFVTGLENALNAKVDDLEVTADGYVYLISNGERISGALGPFASDTEIDPDDLGLEQDTETGYVYPTYKGVRSENGIPLAATGGGGGSAGLTYTITLKNALSERVITVAQGLPVVLEFTYASLDEEGYGDGAGVGYVYVNGVKKRTFTAIQGLNDLDVADIVESGENTVKIKISNSEGSSKSLSYTVTCVALTMATTMDAIATYAGDTTFYYTVTGSGEKTIHFLMDDVEIGTEVVTTSGRSRSYTIPVQAHGAHIFKAYAELSMDGSTIKSNVITLGMMWIGDSTEADIVCTFDRTTAKEGEALTFNYLAYDPTSEQTAVTLSVIDSNGSVAYYYSQGSIEVGRTPQIWAVSDYPAGNVIFRLETRSRSVEFPVTVEASEIVIERITDSLVLDFDAAGRSNNETNPAVWTDGSVSATFEDVIFTTADGWQTDSDGCSVLRLLPGSGMSIPFKLFASDRRDSGATIEVEMATHNVRDYDSVVISCLSNGRGFKVASQYAQLNSEASEISMQFKEDQKVRVSFVIGAKADARMLYVYVDGILCGAIQYPENDDFSQNPAAGITIGAESSGIDIYRIAMYSKGLTRHEILANYIYDRTTLSERTAAYKRNDILNDSEEVVITKLPATLPYMIISCPELPKAKGSSYRKTCEITYVDPADTAKSFTASGVRIGVQGTSSAGYKKKNFLIELLNGLTLTADGSESDTYQLRSDSIPVSTFCLKADVASSEGANNVELVRLYNAVCPYNSPGREADPRVRYGIDGKPIVVFWQNTATNETVFWGKYNFNNDKSTPEAFGFGPGFECWEIKNNTSNRVLFKTSDYTSLDSEGNPAWQNDFEAVYPEDYTDTTHLKALTDWLASTNRESVSTDTEKAALLEKFKAEFEDYFVLSPMLFFYLFTETFLMVDNRAKNFFPVYDPTLDRWYPFAYDMDTAIGINNEGQLVFDYDLEDTDQVDGYDVFNSQGSVLWNNLRDAYASELAAMYQELRGVTDAGGVAPFSYKAVLDQFTEHQDIWPEAVWNEDAYEKYLSPLFQDNDASYLTMLQGNKASQRDWWLFNGFRYRDSKYRAGDSNTNFITLRCYALESITVTPYSHIWPRIKYGSYTVTARGKRNVPVKLENINDDVNDTETYIYSADRLADVGDLAPLQVGYADFTAATKLQKLKLGDGSASYQNTQLKELYVGNNDLLTELDVQNCINLAQYVDLSACDSLETVLANGSGAKGFYLPVGGHVKTLQLPASTVNFTIQDQGLLESVTIEGYNNLTTLRVENTPNIDLETIINSATNLSRVRLVDIEWDATSEATLQTTITRLKACYGQDANGGNTDAAVVSGVVNVPSISDALLGEINDAFPELVVVANGVAKYLIRYLRYDGTVCYQYVAGAGDTAIDPVAKGYITAPSGTASDGMVYVFQSWDGLPSNIASNCVVLAKYDVQIPVKFYDGDGNLLITLSVASGATCEDPVESGKIGTPTKTAAGMYAYSYIGWDTALTNITAPTTVTAVFAASIRTLTVRFYNGDTLLQTVSGVEYGAAAAYTGDTPTNDAADEPTDWEFIGWDPDPSVVEDDLDCYAQFKYIGLVSMKVVARTLAGSYVNDSVESVGDYAFWGQHNIKSVDFLAAKSIGTWAFFSTSLESANFPLVTNVGTYAFKQAEALKEVNLPEAVTLGAEAFNYTALEQAHFPKVTTIDEKTFYNMGSLKSVNLPLLTVVPAHAFNSDTSLTEVSLPEATSLGLYAFGSCIALTSITLPKVLAVNTSALRACAALETVDLPVATTIQAYAFTNDGALSALILRETSRCCTLGNVNAFNNTPIASGTGYIYVPSALVDSYKAATNWSTYADQIRAIEDYPDITGG